MAAPVLQVRGLRFGWPGRVLFDDLTHDVGPGLTWLVGDEGTGKSTLLRLIAGVLPAQHGELSVQGTVLQAQPDAYRARVFWCDPRSPDHDDTRAGDLLDAWSAPWPDADASLRGELVEALALGPHLDKTLHMLSAGSRRKVGLAAALASGAPLTLIDQPLAALDPPSTRLLLEVLHDLADHPARAWLVADHEAHPSLAHRAVWSLDTR